MSRPYFKKRIDELERIFSEAGQDPTTLKALQEELRHRRMPRAVALHQEVKAARELSERPATTARVQRPPAREPSRAAPPGSKAEPRPAMSPRKRPGIVIPPPAAPPRHAGLGPPITPELSASAGTVPPAAEAAQPPDVDALLAAWTTLEVLEPQPLPKPEDLLTMRRRMIPAREHPIPWRAPHYRRQGREKGVFWFLYLGEVDLASAVESLVELFPDESPEPAPRVSGKTTMAALVLDEEGRPARGKTFLSSFAWGYGSVRSGELGSLAAFPDEERRLCAEIENRLIRTDEETEEILPLDAADLRETISWLLDRLNLPAEQVSLEPVAVRVPVWSFAYEAPEPEMLNSFFLGDLTRVRAAIASGNAGRALSAFVTGKAPRPRVDAVRDKAALDEMLAPDHIPSSRWPVRGGYPLSMMQQAAVNHATRELERPGLVGINGPPGTGKTTLLRDVVAKVVLDRATAMAEFEDPMEAFSHVAPLRSGGAFLHLYRLHESLLGHEIVVASSNNKAVENVTREIPSVEAIEEWDPSLRYFASIADQVLRPEGEAPGQDAGQAWGLAAAVLGNSSNRHNFAQSFWWDRQRGMHAYLKGIQDGWSPDVATSDEEGEVELPPEVLALEDAPRDREQALSHWHSARKRFRQALSKAEARRRELSTIRQLLHERRPVEEALEAVSAELLPLRDRLQEARRAAGMAVEQLELARRRASDAVADRGALQSLKPGFFARLFQRAAYREWRERMSEKVLAVDRAREQVTAAEAAQQGAHQAVDEQEARLERKEAEHRQLSDQLADIRGRLDQARAELGEHLPDRRFWNLPDAERQKLSPWLDDRFQAMRDDLFAACFELHRAFIDAAAPRLRHNLGAAMLLLRNRPLSERQEPARRSLWASLFMVVPVLSTTFASVERMFGPLGREQLGWLLIDEAGQAVPQAAVGAAWRSQRVIGIGDPMQIPPVVTMPQRLINAIFATYDVDPDLWSAPLNSVQTLADRASWFGTTLLQATGDVWVGSPLRVHRRCQSPMFEISNRIAYDGLMVQATPPGDSGIGALLGDSHWIHVEGSDPGHWCPEEGEIAAGLLTKLLHAGLLDPDVFFITPFRRVQDRLRERLQPVVGKHIGRSTRSWAKDRVGTIHVFQGRQAEAVVLVLGAPSSQAQGARRWAGGEPNLLNVAASRAKRRLYVVGNRSMWKEAGVFSMLARELREKSWPP